jgi:multidrug efflux pump subunit AcrA (membrane-fusion protein)
LAARLTGWRLDIKGMTEWEAIREARLHAAAEAAAKAAEEAAALAIAQAEAIAVAAGDVEVEKAVEPAVVAEAEAIVEEVSLALEIPETVDTTEQEAVIEASEGDVNDDGVLEALIREEELLKQIEDESAAEDEVQVGISVDDLDSFTLDDIPILDEEDEEEIEEEPIDFAELPVLTPDAGKIRFAEDIVEEVRGGGRRGGGRARRGGGGGSRRR